MTSVSTARSVSAAAFAALAAAFLVPGFVPYYDPAFLPWTWLLSAFFMVLFCALAGVAISGRPAGLIIDNRNRVSLSKFQAMAWTIVVLSAFIVAVFARLRVPLGNAVDIDFSPELLAVMGISATSLVAAPAILSLKSNETPAPGQAAQTATMLGDDPASLLSVGKVYARGSAADAQWLDMFRGEEVSNAASPDLGKMQNFLITVVVLVAYGAALWGMFADAVAQPHSKTLLGALPAFSVHLTWLIGISHAGYLAYKAAPHGASSSAPTSANTPVNNAAS